MQEICPACGEDLTYVVAGRTYSRATSVEILGVYDGGLFYAHRTEDDRCGRAWHRWPEGSDLRVKAEPYLADWNQKVRERELQERLDGN